MGREQILESYLNELIEKYKVQSDILLKVMQHKESSDEEILRTSVAIRFVRGFIDDLNVIKMLK